MVEQSYEHLYKSKRLKDKFSHSNWRRLSRQDMPTLKVFKEPASQNGRTYHWS